RLSSGVNERIGDLVREGIAGETRDQVEHHVERRDSTRALRAGGAEEVKLVQELRRRKALAKGGLGLPMQDRLGIALPADQAGLRQRKGAGVDAADYGAPASGEPQLGEKPRRVPLGRKVAGENQIDVSRWHVLDGAVGAEPHAVAGPDGLAGLG